ncbi:MAG: hypothetical protein ACE5LU_17515 [Anaerolineae bacterium]
MLLTELLIGLSLFLGAFTRLGTAIGTLMSVSIMLSVVEVPGETVWFYIALIGLHLLLGITSSGKTWELDVRLEQKLAGAAASDSQVAELLVRLT